MRATIDGNEATAWVAFRCSEVCCIFPITPSSPMAELADEWSSKGRTNLWGTVPAVVEMQSEGGAAGALHGALQGGALGTTFTASQGLLLMIPNMYKIAGELTSAVMHVAARSLAAQALSIFGDHSDVMAVRQTGFALLSAASVQEAHDLALVAHAATLETRVPFVHFFDGFRTSHELQTIEMLEDEDVRALVSDELVLAHRARGLSPERPFIRGTAQNPDIYFQARESVNPFYARVPDACRARWTDWGSAPAATTARGLLRRPGGRAGPGRDGLRRRHRARDGRLPASTGRTGGRGAAQALPALPRARAGGRATAERAAGGRSGPDQGARLSRRAAVPGRARGVERSARHRGARGDADGDRRSIRPVLEGVHTGDGRRRVRGARTRAAEAAVHDRDQRRRLGTSLAYDASLDIEPEDTVRAVFFGLGSDGTVGANKNTIKILGDAANLHAQGYFVYDSKKSGSQTVSHLRFGPRPIRAPYLVSAASFVGCHQFGLIERSEVLDRAAPGATLLLNCSEEPDRVWDALSRPVQEKILAKDIKLYAIDAGKIAREAGLGRRTNTVLQTCFFAISGVLEREAAIEAIKASIQKTYGKRGAEIVKRNIEAVDRSLAALHQVQVPDRVSSRREARRARARRRS